MSTATIQIRDREYGLIDSAVAKSMPGLELLRAIVAGKFPPPPMAGALDYTIRSVEDGRVVFAGVPKFEFYNPLGMVHGGYAATLLDSAMGCAVHTKLAAGQSYSTLEFKINFTRALTVNTGEVEAIGTIVHVGKKTAVAEGKLVDASGKIYATANTTCIIL
jgi:uncharacterized protein (TIGR00369 family)